MLELNYIFRGSARFCDSRAGSGTSGTQFTSTITAGAAAAPNAATGATAPIRPTAAAAAGAANERTNNGLAENTAETANGFAGGFSQRVRSVRLIPDTRYGLAA